MRIAMWSGPRNISTAMMRAWENRADTSVMDEPFYGAYLKDTGLDHPMRAEVLAHHAVDWDEIAETCATAAGAPIVYQKHMCQHMIPGSPRGWMRAVRHAFLIRPPQAVASSFKRGWEGMGAEDLGYRQQAELFDHVCQITGMAPPVVEARDVLERPEAMLPALCGALGVGFDPAMLSWPAGRRPSDGVWAAHWYRRVEASTGFAPYREPGPVPAELEPIVEACLPYYEQMRAWRLGPVEAGE
ncbi:sulfotransferase-like domain-containing protein [Thermohalobaculum sediminis]